VVKLIAFLLAFQDFVFLLMEAKHDVNGTWRAVPWTRVENLASPYAKSLGGVDRRSNAARSGHC